MNYAVTFTNGYGQVSISVEADSQEEAIRQAIDKRWVNSFSSVSASLMLEGKSRAEVFNQLEQAKALFV